MYAFGKSRFYEQQNASRGEWPKITSLPTGQCLTTDTLYSMQNPYTIRNTTIIIIYPNIDCLRGSKLDKAETKQIATRSSLM